MRWETGDDRRETVGIPHGEGSKTGFRSGFVAILGKANVGKSTLVNSLVGEKTSITSPKAQTTRHRIMGVKTEDKYQIVFVDTPGVRKPKNELDRFMEKIYRDESKNADILLFVTDGSRPCDDDDVRVRELLKKTAPPNHPVLLVINKIDLLEPADRDLREEAFLKLGAFNGVHMISALRRQGLKELESGIVELLPEGPLYFPEPMRTDQSLEIRAAEIVREKILMKTRQEIPHGVFVYTEEMRDGIKDADIYFRIIIYVEKESHKGILIGKGGEKLKRIGMIARKEIEQLTGRDVYIDLWVKVKEKWKERRDLLKSWGYEI